MKLRCAFSFATCLFFLWAVSPTNAENDYEGSDNFIPDGAKTDEVDPTSYDPIQMTQDIITLKSLVNNLTAQLIYTQGNVAGNFGL